MSVPSRVAIWLFCLSPLVWIPGGFDRFVFPKLVLATAGIAAAGLAVRAGRLPKPVAVVAVAGLAWFALACLLSPTPWASFFGRWPRYEGVPVLLAYAGCAWAGARLLGNRRRADVETLATALSVTSLLLGFVSVCSALGWSIEGESVESRTGSVLGNATDQGMVAMMLAAVLFAVWSERRTPLLLAGLGASALTLVLSGSRASLLAAVVVVAGQVLLRRRELARYAAGALVVLVGLALALPQTRDRITEGRTIEGRWLLWKESLHVGADRWWSGGPSTFVDAIGRHKDADWVRVIGTRNPPDSPHSWLLQALVAGGIPLLLLAVALAVLVLRAGWLAVRRAPEDSLTLGALAATVGYGLALLPNFTVAGSTCLAAFLTGVLVGQEASRTERPALPRALAGVAAAGVVLFALGAFAERSLSTGIHQVLGHDTAAAQQAFDQAHHLRPWDADVAMLAAQALAAPADGGDPEAARETERWARRSLDRTPDTYAAGLALAVAQRAQGDLDGATRTLDRLVRLYPTEPGARIERGRVRFGRRDVDGARADLAEARRLDPRDRTPRRLLREIEKRLGAGRS
ncbi:MAG: O-antigen ligase family protein [Nocardioidaceae bacterium]|nr:O-antigen ligase family protein [Nocardioidaceae bacterium]